MLVQLVLTEFFKRELFLCLSKVDQVIKSCKEPYTFNNYKPSFEETVSINVVRISCVKGSFDLPGHVGKRIFLACKIESQCLQGI